jgi:hypothetical protein
MRIQFRKEELVQLPEDPMIISGDDFDSDNRFTSAAALVFANDTNDFPVFRQDRTAHIKLGK